MTAAYGTQRVHPTKAGYGMAGDRGLPTPDQMPFTDAWAIIENFGGGDALVGMENFQDTWFAWNDRDWVSDDEIDAYNVVLKGMDGLFNGGGDA